jgi:hypothetical protein
MNKQFAELKVFELGGIAFCEATETLPFLVLPKGQATIKPWGPSGFVFENIITGDVIAFVSEYDDILDSTGNPYDATQLDVITALAAFFFELGGGGGDLESVLIAGNTSGANDIIFDATQGLQFDNFSRLREGTIDAGTGGVKGIAQICGAGYELKWEAGVQYVMGSSGNTIRISLYNFNNVPTVTDDDTKGYQIGSYWATDDGAVYYCGDATTGAAVWTLFKNAVPTLLQVLSSNKSAQGTGITNLTYLDFDTAAAHTVVEGELAWNNTDGTLDLGLQGGFKNKLGQQLVVRARNTSGSLISKGSVVKVVGVAGGLIGINLAQGDSVANSATAFGIVAEDIADSSNGFVTINGIVHGLNTNAFTEGDILYLSPTVAGEITNVKPVSPSHAVVVGYVAKKSATDGHILLHVQNGYELDELHNVSIAGAANNDALVYESATSLWKNKTIGGWNYIVKSANQDVTNSATLVDDTELQFSVVAGGQYMIEMDVVISASNTANDYKNALVLSAGTMKGSGILTSNSAGTVGQASNILASAAISTNTSAIGTALSDIDLLHSIKIIYSFTASANATFKYQFAQNSATAATTARTFKGSILKYKKIN